jgi:hypothetical protein
MDRDEQTKNNQDDENTASGQMYEILEYYSRM